MTSLTFQTYRLQLVRERPAESQTKPILDCPQAVSKQLSPLFDGLDREHVVLALDARTNRTRP